MGAAIASCLAPRTKLPSFVSSTTCKTNSSSRSAPCSFCGCWLRVTEGVRQEEVIFQTMVIVIDHIRTKIAAGMLDSAEGLAQVVQGDDIGRQDVGAAPQLPPALLIPDLAVAAFFL